jgi:hypothetical protein
MGPAAKLRPMARFDGNLSCRWNRMARDVVVARGIRRRQRRPYAFLTTSSLLTALLLKHLTAKHLCHEFATQQG